jgi:hypothetical protein
MGRWIALAGLLVLVLLAVLVGMAGGYNARLVELLRVWIDTLADILVWAIIAGVLLALVLAALIWYYRRRRRTATGAVAAGTAVAPPRAATDGLLQRIPTTQPPAATSPPDHIPRATFDHVPARPSQHSADQPRVSSPGGSDDVPS